MEQRQQTADILKFPRKRKPRKKPSKLKAYLKKSPIKIEYQEIATIIIGVVLADLVYDLIRALFYTV